MTDGPKVVELFRPGEVLYLSEHADAETRERFGEGPHVNGIPRRDTRKEAKHPQFVSILDKRGNRKFVSGYKMTRHRSAKVESE